MVEDIDPRFSYANERTFLAWNRTALALIGVGLAVANLLAAVRLRLGPADDRPAAHRPRRPGVGRVPAGVDRQRAGDASRSAPARSRLPLLIAVVVAAVAVLAVVISLLGATD